MTAQSQQLPTESTDVLVIGGGNAGFTAAHAAAERGRSVILLEKGTRDMAGGNSFYTAGASRIAHNGLEELREFIEPDERHDRTWVSPYSAQDFAADLAKVTEGRNDPELTEVLVTESQPTMRWLHGLGMKYRLMYERQSYEQPDGSFKFWGGVHVGNVGGGEGLMADHRRIADRLGVDVCYGHRAERLVVEGGVVVGAEFEADGRRGVIRAESVILTAGGFESDPQARREHLGEGWDNAKVRGTPLNTGDMLTAALEAGAAKGGDWSTCHSVQWDAFAAGNESNRELGNRLTRQSYPLGILVNTEGNRFLDEGADFRDYTYALYGKEVLKQPGSVAYQVFDDSVRSKLRTMEYGMPGISEVVAETITELADKIGVDPAALERTVVDFNASIDRSVAFDPAVRDGRRADTQPPKSNWAVPLEGGPFYAYGVTCAITFTFGGLTTDTHGRVLNTHGEPIPGLFAAGEMLAGLFAGNYPGGSGLPAGFVFGHRAGSVA